MNEWFSIFEWNWPLKPLLWETHFLFKDGQNLNEAVKLFSKFFGSKKIFKKYVLFFLFSSLWTWLLMMGFIKNGSTEWREATFFHVKWCWPLWLLENFLNDPSFLHLSCGFDMKFVWNFIFLMVICSQYLCLNMFGSASFHCKCIARKWEILATATWLSVLYSAWS